MTCTRLEVFEETSRRKRNVSGAAYGVDLPMGMPFERTHGNIELAAAQDERGKNAHAQAVLDHSHNRIIIPGRQLRAHRQARAAEQRRDLSSLPRSSRINCSLAKSARETISAVASEESAGTTAISSSCTNGRDAMPAPRGSRGIKPDRSGPLPPIVQSLSNRPSATHNRRPGDRRENAQSPAATRGSPHSKTYRCRFCRA